MKKLLITITSTILLFGACDSKFPDALSSPEKIKGYALLKNSDDTLSSPVIEGKFICKTSINPLKNLCKSENYNNKLPVVDFKLSNINNTLYVDKDIEFNSSNVGEIIITKPNVTITLKAPYTDNSLTNIQKIKSITDNTGSVTLIFKGGDYYIESININDENRKPPFKTSKTSFTIQTPNNSRLFVKNFEIKNYKPIPLNISLNENNNNPNALLIYSIDNFNIITKGKVKGNLYLYGYENIYLKANPESLIKGAIHSDKELSDYRVRVEYVKPENMYKLIVCNTLPPMPDEKKNNETLLGIDSNNNGIRDDVEIKILNFKPSICRFRPDAKRCNLSHNPAFIAVSFQMAKAFQKILKEFDGSEEKAYELEKVTSRLVYCNEYFWNYWEYDPISIKYIENIVFNNNNRKQLYYEFNKQLSRGVFSSPNDSDSNPFYCDFNTSLVKEK
ncbi:hypothetical protein C6V80_03430 [Caminibacter pacificus]|uniref:Lipoprotein n=2 Tax=Caminibacter pacificus TaxID=1424653 RepID=A0ABX5TJU9_9BACT|nr:hypothetical protein [Caminibacter pacificus]QCI28043.2 hypothetical protein C6V80_03430 [Caminibacter pacificus]